MKDELITPETVKLAKEKGFEFNTTLINQSYVVYKDENQLSTKGIDFSDQNKEEVIPTQSLLQRWLREVHKIEININSTRDQNRFEIGYNYWIWNTITGEEINSEPKKMPSGNYKYDTYEEALEEGLQEALKLIKL